MVVTPDTLTVKTRALTSATPEQWAVMEEIRSKVPDTTVILRERVLSAKTIADAPSRRIVTAAALKRVGPLRLLAEFVVPESDPLEVLSTVHRRA